MNIIKSVKQLEIIILRVPRIEDDNLILMSKMPRFVEEKLGIAGDFYVYRDHLYENTVSKERAIEEGRPTKRGKKIFTSTIWVRSA